MNAVLSAARSSAGLLSLSSRQSQSQIRSIWNWKIGWAIRPPPRPGTPAFKTYTRKKRAITWPIITAIFGGLYYAGVIVLTTEEIIDDIRKDQAKKVAKEEEEYKELLRLAELRKAPVKDPYTIYQPLIDSRVFGNAQYYFNRPPPEQESEVKTTPKQ